MPDTTAVLTYLDGSGESSTLTLYVEDIDGGSYDGVIAGIGTQDDTGTSVVEALSSLTEGTFNKVALRRAYLHDPNIPGPNAQRERKWMVTAVDTTAAFGGGDPNPGFNRKFNFEIPIALVNGDTLLEGTDQADLGFGGWAAFVGRYEANCLSPWGGTPAILEARVVGRNI